MIDYCNTSLISAILQYSQLLRRYIWLSRSAGETLWWYYERAQRALEKRRLHIFEVATINRRSIYCVVLSSFSTHIVFRILSANEEGLLVLEGVGSVLLVISNMKSFFKFSCSVLVQLYSLLDWTLTIADSDISFSKITAYAAKRPVISGSFQLLRQKEPWLLPN